MLIEWFKGFSIEEATHLHNKSKIIAEEHGDYEWSTSTCIQVEEQLLNSLTDIDSKLLFPTVYDFYNDDYDPTEHMNALSNSFNQSLQYLQSLDFNAVEKQLASVSTEFKEEIDFLLSKWKDVYLVFINIIK